ALLTPLRLVQALTRPPDVPPLFPYTTLFRSSSATVKEGQDWPAMVGDRMVSEKPEKVVSLSPMITEALLSLPGHEALCAVTEYRSEEHTSELQSRFDLVCRLLLEKKNT